MILIYKTLFILILIITQIFAFNYFDEQKPNKKSNNTILNTNKNTNTNTNTNTNNKTQNLINNENNKPKETIKIENKINETNQNSNKDINNQTNKIPENTKNKKTNKNNIQSNIQSNIQTNNNQNLINKLENYDDNYHYMGKQYSLLSINSINFISPITQGSSQNLIDKNTICISSNGNRFGESGAKILMGHNYTDIKKMYNLKIGDILSFQTKTNNYKYIVTNLDSGVISPDGSNIIDANNNNLIEYNSKLDVVYIYTCIGNNPTNKRFVIKALKI